MARVKYGPHRVKYVLWVSAQFSQGVRCPLTDSLDIVEYVYRKAHIRMFGQAGCSGPSLSAYDVKDIFYWCLVSQKSLVTGCW